ncbi:unnamed protein product [Dovyalis caffra]|uniref:Uncharacterized protein n=1 Tax=Dovyalis caffra TaxID=77055 RepID=A0AAV1SJD5_9ROSI|nr:unnamed protein product [Dovyalis caffra]
MSLFSAEIIFRGEVFEVAGERLLKIEGWDQKFDYKRSKYPFPVKMRVLVGTGSFGNGSTTLSLDK